MNKESIIRDEYPRFIEFGKSGFFNSTTFADPTHARLVDVANCLHHNCGGGLDHVHASPIEFAVLLRQIVRRYRDGLNKEVVVTLPDGVDDRILARVGITSIPVRGGFQSLRATEWSPDWLEATVGRPVDASSLSPLDVNARAQHLHTKANIVADFAFSDATGNTTYRSLGQLAATRSALSIEAGGTLIAQLPTGGGKTDVAITVVKAEILEKSRTNVLIVPTVALALDLERRFKSIIGDVWGYQEEIEDLPLLWTGGTSKEVRDQIKSRISSAEQPILITSPETLALDNGVGAALEIAAANGQVGWMIVDEAHIIKQWGQDFRPEFLDIVPLRNKLKRCAEQNGYEPLRTLLLSATLTSETLEYLSEKFEDDAPLHLCAANELRSEIDTWTDVSTDEVERTEKFIEAIHHLPRPIIVYATKPDKADDWVELLRSKGFTRTSAFSGKTVGKDREDILEGFRNDLGEESRYDIVVATSAFGLGVDYDQVRSVVHVCLPETVDRWYQEIGRGGRDGYESTAVTLACESDLKDAMNLGVSVLTPSTAWKRYQNILSKLGIGSKDDPSLRYFNLHDNPDEVEKGSYNRRWNKQTLRGLIDIGVLEQRITWWRDIPKEDREKLDDIHEEDEIRAEIMRLKIIRNLNEDEFKNQWEEWKSDELGPQENSLTNFLEVLSRKKSVCELLETVYMDSEELASRFGKMSSSLRMYAPCGNCPNCRTNEIGNQRTIPPAPINRMMSRNLILDQELISIFEKHTKNHLQIEVECENAEGEECMELIRKFMRFHLIDLRQEPQEMEHGVWSDDNLDLLACSPLHPTVVLHDGNLSSKTFQQINRRIYLGKQKEKVKVPMFLLGPKSGYQDNFYMVKFDTFKHWLLNSPTEGSSDD
jgi:ATP-dependent DNA helicase RecQ